jgi:PAS domain S-box-containing protein
MDRPSDISAEPNKAPSDPPLAEERRVAALAGAADNGPILVAVFHLPSLQIAHMNRTGRDWLNRLEDAPGASYTLRDVFAVGSIDRLEREILVHARVLGEWRGTCKLRDAWGSGFPVDAVFTRESGDLLSLSAVRHLGSDDLGGISDRELLQALLETSSDTIYFKDVNSRFVRVSRSLALKDGNTDTTALIGKTDFDRFDVSHAQQAFDDEQAIMRSGEPITDLEEKLVWPDGRVRWASTSKMPLRDRGGRIVGTFGITRDITARRSAEEERKEMEVRLGLAQKMESIGRLAAGVAHEINTPLQFVADNSGFLQTAFAQIAQAIKAHRWLLAIAKDSSTFTEVVREVEAAEEKAESDYLFSEIPKVLEQNLEGIGRISRIVASLKEFSHPGTGRASADLNRVVETAATVSRHEWRYVADIVKDFDPKLPPISCFLDELNQALLNLIVNAAHAIAGRKDGVRGTITLRTRRDGDWAVVEVGDTGCGIPPEIHNRIFDPFFTTKEVGRGTGQGLTQVHSVVVRTHKGEIDFTSEVGRGTTFRLKLPLRAPIED